MNIMESLLNKISQVEHINESLSTLTFNLKGSSLKKTHQKD